MPGSGVEQGTGRREGKLLENIDRDRRENQGEHGHEDGHPYAQQGC